METQRLRTFSLASNTPIVHDYGFSYVKIVFVVVLFILSLLSFVTQTELTSLVYSEYGFHEPILLLYLTHASWWMLWPCQFLVVALTKAFRRFINRKSTDQQHQQWKGLRRAITSSIKAQHRNVFYTAELTAKENVNGYKMIYANPKKSFRDYKTFINSDAIKYLFKTCLMLSVVLNFAGVTWYIAMGLSTGADVTAIYNCSAFTAYVFGIFILGDNFSILKASAVVVAISGVFMVAYLGGASDSNGAYPHRLLGNFIILFGAILYGLYEVIYKKMACPPSNEVSARRQATFSNFVMCLLGIATFIILTPIITIVHLSGIHHFDIPNDPNAIKAILISILANQVFSVTFLALMSLTSPVFSSVASLLTILVVGIYEWEFRSVSITTGQFLGYFFIMVGFMLLTFCSWGEISEEDRDDENLEIETDSESIANSC